MGSYGWRRRPNASVNHSLNGFLTPWVLIVEAFDARGVSFVYAEDSVAKAQTETHDKLVAVKQQARADGGRRAGRR